VPRLDLTRNLKRFYDKPICPSPSRPSTKPAATQRAPRPSGGSCCFGQVWALRQCQHSIRPEPNQLIAQARS